MEQEKIIDLVLGELTPEERAELLKLIADSPENREEYYRIKNLWALVSQHNHTSKVEDADVSRLLSRIRANKKKKFRKIILSVTKYAALILMAFLFGKFSFNKVEPDSILVTYNEVTVPSGQMAQLTLSDGTIVYINSCSKLKYPAIFTKGERKVLLTGEAYFSVVENDNAPFIVETDKRKVKVLGTKFNVMAYPNDKYYLTTLVEGKVLLLDSAGTEITRLKPGQQFFYDNTKSNYTVKDVKTTLFTSWKEGLYQFDHVTLKGLTESLERIFAVKIIINDPEIENYKFTGTISRNVPFEQILKIIQISSPIKYKLHEKNGAITEATLYSNKQKKGGM